MMKDMSYTPHCIVCGCESFKMITQQSEYVVRQCVNCGLGITTPFPPPNTQRQVNTETYTLENRLYAYNNRIKEFEARYQSQCQHIVELLPRSQSTILPKLLDIGCSLGHFLQVAKRSGFSVQGVELSSESAAYARAHGLDVFCGTLEDAHYPDNSFDVITLWDVLEHVPDPAELLNQIHRLLKPDGILAIQSPNINSKMREICGSAWNWWLLPDHLYHFSSLSLEKLLQKSLYKIVSFETWEPPVDFLLNVIPAKASVLGAGFFYKAVRRLSILGIPAFAGLLHPFQAKWWRAGQGALVMLHVKKLEIES